VSILKANSKIYIKIKECWPEIAMLVFSFIYLYVITSSPYMSDDIYSSLNKGSFILEGKSLLQGLLETYKGVFSSGRVELIGLVTVTLSSLDLPLYVYKLLIVILIVINIFVFGRLVFLIFKSIEIQFLTMFLVIIAIPISSAYQHNPVYSFFGFMQLTFFIFEGVIFAFVKYLRNDKKKYLYLSCLFLFISMLSYEACFSFVILPMALVLIKRRNVKDIFKDYIPIIVTAVLALSIYLLLRIMSNQSFVNTKYSGTTVSLNIVNVIKTYYYQTTASFPFFYWISHMFDKTVNLLYVPSDIIYKSTLWELFVGVLSGVVFYILCKRLSISSIKIEKSINLYQLLIIGAALLLLPGIMIAVSTKYQGELSLGSGYIPVYWECFGISVLLCILFACICKVKSKILKKVFFAVISLLVFYSSTASQLNARIIFMTRPYTQTANSNIRSGITKSIKEGILSTVPENSIIVPLSYAVHVYGTLNQQDEESKFYTQEANKIMKVMSLEEFKDTEGIGDFSDNDNVYFSNYISPDIQKNNGMFLLAKAPTENKQYAQELFTNEIYICFQGLTSDRSFLKNEIEKFGSISKVNDKGAVWLLDLNEYADFSIFSKIIYNCQISRSPLEEKDIESVWYEQLTLPLTISSGSSSFNRSLSAGWSGIEGWGVWSDGNKATLTVDVPNISQDLYFQIFGNTIIDNLDVDVYVNDEFIKKVYINKQDISMGLEFLIPKDVVEKDSEKIKIDFVINNPKRPSELQLGSTDNRLLGIGLQKFSLSYDNFN